MRLPDEIKIAIENALQCSVLRTAKSLDEPRLRRFWIMTKKKPRRKYLVYVIADTNGWAFYIVPEGARLNWDGTKDWFLPYDQTLRGETHVRGRGN